MKLELTDTLEYNGESFEYEKQYFTRGLMNQAVRVYQSDDGSEIHYDPQTGLKKVVDPQGSSNRVEVSDDESGSDSVLLEESGHRSY
jgi:hypothetical protein